MRISIIVAVVWLALPVRVVAFGFPEIGFCPLGGPPGWFNRISGQHDKRDYPPSPFVYRVPVLSPAPYPRVRAPAFYTQPVRHGWRYRY